MYNICIIACTSLRDNFRQAVSFHVTLSAKKRHSDYTILHHTTIISRHKLQYSYLAIWNPRCIRGDQSLTGIYLSADFATLYTAKYKCMLHYTFRSYVKVVVVVTVIIIIPITMITITIIILILIKVIIIEKGKEMYMYIDTKYNSLHIEELNKCTTLLAQFVEMHAQDF